MNILSIKNFVNSERSLSDCIRSKIHSKVVFVVTSGSTFSQPGYILSDNIMDKINMLKAQMARNFDMKDLGVAKQILGIEIHRNKRNGKLSFSHEKYVEKILVRLGMNNAKIVNVPLAFHFKLSSGLCPSDE